MDDLLASEVEEVDDLLASLLEGKAVGVPKTWLTLFLLSRTYVGDRTCKSYVGDGQRRGCGWIRGGVAVAIVGQA